jgi:hypothetical protein
LLRRGALMAAGRFAGASKVAVVGASGQDLGVALE